MTRQFCDRCGKDITGKKAGRVTAIGDADEDGNGDVDWIGDLCPPCFAEARIFTKTRPKK